MTQRFYLPRQQLLTNLGDVGAGWKLYTYTTGTSTPKATYSDTSLSAANTNPIIADSNGRLSDIFVDDLATYKAILKDDSNNIIWTSDPIDPKVFTLDDFDPRPTSYWGSTAGTGSAYTLDANPDIAAYSANHTFYAQVHSDSAANATMNINGNRSLNIKKFTGQGTKVSISAKDLIGGQTHHFRNDGTDIVVLDPRNIMLYTGPSDELTISSGAITINNSTSSYTVDTESDASSDDLVTISGGSEDQVILISPANDSRAVVVKHTTDNIRTDTGTDITMDSDEDVLTLKYNGTEWVVVARSVKNDFKNTTSNDGYMKLPNGMIFQWGRESVEGDSYTTHSFPLVFPNSCFVINTTYKNTSGGLHDVGAAEIVNNSTFGLANGADDSITIMWMAIGN